MIKLGEKVKETITGYTGIVMARTAYLTGCTQVALAGKVLKDGTVPEWQWFDEKRCVSISKTVVDLEKEDTGGIHQKAPNM